MHVSQLFSSYHMEIMALFDFTVSFSLHFQQESMEQKTEKNKCLNVVSSGLTRRTMTVQPQTIKKVKCSLLLPPLVLQRVIWIICLPVHCELQARLLKTLTFPLPILCSKTINFWYYLCFELVLYFSPILYLTFLELQFQMNSFLRH